MIKKIELKIPIILLLNAAYYFMISAVNSALAPYAYIVLPAIFIVPAARWLGMGGLAFVVVLSSVLVEPFMPLPTGICSIIWLFAALAARELCMRTEKIRPAWAIVVMEMVNISIIIVYAAALPNAAGSLADYAARIAIDALASSAVLAAVSKIAMDLPADVEEILSGIGGKSEY